SVQQVNDIINRISTASNEQADGIGEVNRAVGQMDDMTQQNAALVEQAAAAAASLHDQTVNLARAISIFEIEGTDTVDDTAIDVVPALAAPADDDAGFADPVERRAPGSPMRTQQALLDRSRQQGRKSGTDAGKDAGQRTRARGGRG